MADESAGEFIDVETVQAELAPILNLGSWTRARLEELKSQLGLWMGEMDVHASLNPELHRQHHDAGDPLDNAILAEHERVDSAEPVAPEGAPPLPLR